MGEWQVADRVQSPAYMQVGILFAGKFLGRKHKRLGFIGNDAESAALSDTVASARETSPTVACGTQTLPSSPSTSTYTFTPEPGSKFRDSCATIRARGETSRLSSNWVDNAAMSIANTEPWSPLALVPK